MTKRLYEYLKNEWRINNSPKYQILFEEWINNLTDDQIYYYDKLWLNYD